ncbi:MAG: hypothetical protein DRJ98_07945 [Thermoprotei archaeon]|nr:MAG: hypothetical protein DRJ98_07945 [Thermoprotei archaeon]
MNPSSAREVKEPRLAVVAEASLSLPASMKPRPTIDQRGKAISRLSPLVERKPSEVQGYEAEGGELEV